jgi:hypothetical protein
VVVEARPAVPSLGRRRQFVFLSAEGVAWSLWSVGLLEYMYLQLLGDTLEIFVLKHHHYNLIVSSIKDEMHNVLPDEGWTITI